MLWIFIHFEPIKILSKVLKYWINGSIMNNINYIFRKKQQYLLFFSLYIFKFIREYWQFTIRKFILSLSLLCLCLCLYLCLFLSLYIYICGFYGMTNYLLSSYLVTLSRKTLALPMQGLGASSPVFFQVCGGICKGCVSLFELEEEFFFFFVIIESNWLKIKCVCIDMTCICSLHR